MLNHPMALLNQESVFSKTFLLASILLIFIGLPKSFAQIQLTFEAEAAKLSGEANIVACSNASGGEMVRGIHEGLNNSLEFQEVFVENAGRYFIRLCYLYTSDRSFTYKINDESARSHSIKASGAWCFQGGSVVDFVFEDTLQAGNNLILFYDSPIIDKIEVLSDTSGRPPQAFYISSSTGNDDLDGLSPESAWKSLEKASAHKLIPGDALLFKTGDTFLGRLMLLNEGGTADAPVTISAYGTGPKPVIEGNGFLSAVHLVNSDYIHISKLHISNNGGPAQPGESTKLRYGLYLQNTFSDGTVFDHFRFQNLHFSNIYPTEQITDDDQSGIHAYAINTSGSWGDDIHPTRFNDLLIEDCFISRTGRHAIRMAACNDLTIRNNLIEHVGGAGMVMAANSSNILIEHNTTNYTGSDIDPRMAARGSGLWCFRTKNLTAQHNKFMHARGIKDSFGMHIDIGNQNVVYQYNYSKDNEGGFVEILGANVNVGYRYNLSIGDGWRTRGPQVGRIFWIGGWSGNPTNPIGSDSVFIYNNSVYVPDNIAPSIWIEAVTKNNRIYNNIVYLEKDFGTVFIKNNPSFNDFDYNIWYGNIPTVDTDGDFYRGFHSSTFDPEFVDQVIHDAGGFVLRSGSGAMEKGKLMYEENIAGSFDGYSNHGGRDYFGHPVSTTRAPHIGAYNWLGDVVSDIGDMKQTTFSMYPNPIRNGQELLINMTQNIGDKLLEVQLLDLKGRVVFQQKFNGKEEFSIKLDDIETGYYVVWISNGNWEALRTLVVW